MLNFTNTIYTPIWLWSRGSVFRSTKRSIDGASFSELYDNDNMIQHQATEIFDN